MSITADVFHSACQTLLDQNKPVTIRNIRHVLGKGSMTTLSNFLKEWKQTAKKNVTKNVTKAPKKYGNYSAYSSFAKT